MLCGYRQRDGQHKQFIYSNTLNYGTDQYTISTIIKKKHTNAFSTTQVYTIKHLSAGKFTTIYGERNFNKPKQFTNAKVTFPTILEMHCSRCNKTSLFAPPRKCGE